MIARRRLTLQLTPLLDLMLIVMFSQHLAFRQHTATEQQALQQRRQSLLLELQTREEQLTLQHQSLSRQYLESARLLNSFLTPSQNAQLARQLANFPDVRQTLEQHTRNSPEGAARFLTRASAMQKHVTIWEVHLPDSGRAELRCDELTESTDFASPEEFASRLFQASKRLPTPHSLTLVLLSWGDTQLRPRQNALDGLPLLLDQLRRDAAGIRWYDFSVTGYRPRGTLPDPPSPPTNP
ncbi:MAG: hypothetical protein ACKO2P_19845 [Planctomycetota bacterium]